MKRRTVALASLLLLLGSSSGLASSLESSHFTKKYENKVSEFFQLYVVYSTYANMVIAEEVKFNDTTKQYSLVSPFNAVTKGQKLKPNLFSNILEAPVSEELPLEIVVLDPDNKMIQAIPMNVNTKEKNTKLTLITTFDSISFDKAGDYKIQLFMNWNGEKVKIGQTIIVSR